MTAILRRLDYRFRPRLRRETCKRCWRENAVGFSVPNDVWRAVVPARHIENVLCLTCFDRYATARGVDWTARGCDLYAVSGVRFTATSRSRPSSSPDTRCTARPLEQLEQKCHVSLPFRLRYELAIEIPLSSGFVPPRGRAIGTHDRG